MESTRPRAPCTLLKRSSLPAIDDARALSRSGRLCRWSPQVFLGCALGGRTDPPRRNFLEVWERRYADDACRRAAREECGHRLRMCFSFTFTRTTHIPICVHGCGHIYAGACSQIRGALVKGQKHILELPDFAVVQLFAGKSARDRLRARLQNSPLVSSVTFQQVFQHSSARRLLAGARTNGGAGTSSTGQSVHHSEMPFDFITRELNASHWWRLGASGSGVRIAIFDTGLNADHTKFLRRRAEVVDFTSEKTTDDNVGHSTFMAGCDRVDQGVPRLCAGRGADVCPCLRQPSVLDHVLVPRRLQLHPPPPLKVRPDQPLRGRPRFPRRAVCRQGARSGDSRRHDRVRRGQLGADVGLLLNPADEAWVVGVGGLRASDGLLAAWSSRGPTLWELPHGAGRMGVDVVTHGEFWAIHPSGRCQRQYGTSVACPVVVAVLALLLSSLGAEQRRLLRSPQPSSRSLQRAHNGCAAGHSPTWSRARAHSARMLSSPR